MPFPCGPLQVQSMALDGDDQRVMLLREFCWVSRKGKPSITIEAGYVTDYASIPRLMWRFVGHPAMFREESLPHDWLYSEYDKHTYTRAEADRFFREILEERGRPAWKCWAMWLGVRLGGWVPWRRYRAGQF